MSDGQLVQILEGNTFVVSDRNGDIDASPIDATGLFSFDTRFLSKWVLTIDGERLERSLDRRPAVLRDAVLPRPGDRHRLHRREALGDPPARRRRRLPRGADDPEPRRRSRCTLEVRLEAASDFADLFEVKDALKKKGSYSPADRAQPARARLHARVVRARDRDHHDGAGEDRRDRTDVQGQGRGARRVEDRTRRQDRVRRRGATRVVDVHRAAAGTWRAASTSGSPSAPRLECDSDSAAAHLPPQPRRPRGAALLDPHDAGALASRRGAAVVHDHVRPGQHLHEPAGAAVHAGARRDDARSRSASGRAPASTTSATRTRAGSSTRCATAR